MASPVGENWSPSITVVFALAVLSTGRLVFPNNPSSAVTAQSPPLNHLLYRCGLRTSDELPAILRKFWQSAQALVWSARGQFGNPVCRVELRQGGRHEPPPDETPPPFGVNLWASESSPCESYSSSLAQGVAAMSLTSGAPTKCAAP